MPHDPTAINSGGPLSTRQARASALAARSKVLRFSRRSANRLRLRSADFGQPRFVNWHAPGEEDRAPAHRARAKKRREGENGFAEYENREIWGKNEERKEKRIKKVKTMVKETQLTGTDYSYILGREFVIFSNGVTMSREEFKLFHTKGILVKKIMSLARVPKRLSDYQELYGDLYNLEATPAESTAYRLAKHDVKKYPAILTAADDGKTPYCGFEISKTRL